MILQTSTIRQAGLYRQKLHILSERIDKALDALIPSCTGITDVGALVKLLMMKIYRRSATRAFLICSVGDEGESSLDNYGQHTHAICRQDSPLPVSESRKKKACQGER